MHLELLYSMSVRSFSHILIYEKSNFAIVAYLRGPVSFFYISNFRILLITFVPGNLEGSNSASVSPFRYTVRYVTSLRSAEASYSAEASHLIKHALSL